MNHPFEQQLQQQWPWQDWADVTVVIAVSGGPDSVALLRAAHALRAPGSGRLVVGHFNHRLRGEESDRDASFVEQLAAQLQLPFRSDQASEVDQRSSREEETRRMRYDFFIRTAKALGARYVLTAHTADDQAETILHRILRGTGLDGLAGIPASRELLPGVSLVRPMLPVSRTQVLAYLADLEQPFRRDATNAETHFTRNRLRQELIPLLEQQYNPRVKEALIRLGQLAGDAQRVVAESLEELRQRAVESARPRGAIIRCRELAGVPGYVVRQLLIAVWRENGWSLRDMSGEHWRRLAELTGGQSDAPPRRETFPGNVLAERQDDLLRLTRPAA